ncbi:MAG: fibrobacter succinogenes major paralogous domain-containing protein [Prolixibacteraceae bacterium]|nr:fibrobacter succinogenes major paralogous domain-containing protein [Prolixibacteraceae bacterium]
MKKIKILSIILLSIALVYLSTASSAQSPEKVSYQSVIRDASGELVRSQSVGIRISILQGSAGGTAVYVETHTPETNVNGLATIEVGNGTPVSGTFSSIDWSNGPYFLKVETDPAGGTSYSIAGTSEIMSVPYALYAKTSETAQSVSPSSFQAPTATTLAATNVGSTSATLNGTVNANGFLSTVVFQWGTTSAYGNEISTTSVTGTGNESVSEDLTGLDYGTTYHYRIKAVNAVNETYSGDMPFTTSMSLPQLTTSAVTSVLSTTATSGGNITTDGGSAVTARGVCWNTSGDPTTADSKTTDGTGVGSFISSITGLSTGTTYYVRAYATSGEGTTYGNEVSFRTFDGTVTDEDGNEYLTISIGDQIWMAENLKTTQLNNSSAIANVTDNTTWAALTTPAYCWYDNDETTYKNTNGALYNWHTVNTGNLCPTGWHVPNDDEWTTLTDYLINNSYGYDDGGTDIAKAMATVSGWTSSAVIATPGNDQASNNASGFAGYPAGNRSNDGTFDNVNDYGYWWSLTEFSTTNGNQVNIGYNLTDVQTENSDKKTGLSVRCVKNSTPTVTTSAVTVNSETTASGGGEVTFNGGATVTARGVCWNTSGSPTTDDDKTTDGTGTGTFTSALSSLTANTTYYIRAYATSDEGTAYGRELIFKTYTGTVTDIRGNVYYTVTIGSQEWMAENLRTTRYNDDTVIPNVIDNTTWAALTTPAYCWYNNDEASYKETYGALYNWYAVETGKLCPTGWHVPTDTDWTILNGDPYHGTINTKTLASNSGWNESLIFNTPGNDQTSNNSTGFNALPSGFRLNISGSFEEEFFYSYFWTSTEDFSGERANN